MTSSWTGWRSSFAQTSEAARTENAKKLIGILNEVDEKLNKLTLGANEKIEELLKKIRSDDDAAAIEKEAKAKGKIQLTRKQAFESLALIKSSIKNGDVQNLQQSDRSTGRSDPCRTEQQSGFYWIS